MIRIYQAGKVVEKKLDPDVGGPLQEIVSECETQIRSADSILRLAVSARLLEEIRENEKAVELHYDQPRRFTITAFSDRAIDADGLLIPLSGRFAQDGITTIFLLSPGARSGPYRNRRGVAELRALVESQ